MIDILQDLTCLDVEARVRGVKKGGGLGPHAALAAMSEED